MVVELIYFRTSVNNFKARNLLNLFRRRMDGGLGATALEI